MGELLPCVWVCVLLVFSLLFFFFPQGRSVMLVQSNYFHKDASSVYRHSGYWFSCTDLQLKRMSDGWLKMKLIMFPMQFTDCLPFVAFGLINYASNIIFISFIFSCGWQVHLTAIQMEMALWDQSEILQSWNLQAGQNCCEFLNFRFYRFYFFVNYWIEIALVCCV